MKDTPEISAVLAETENPLAKALAVAGYNNGLEWDGKCGFVIKGRYVDAYLLSLTLAARIAAGDVEVVEKGDTLGTKEYFDRLVESCADVEVNGEPEPNLGD